MISKIRCKPATTHRCKGSGLDNVFFRSRHFDEISYKKVARPADSPADGNVQTLKLLSVQFVPSVYKTDDDEENPEDYLYLLDHLFFFPFSFVFFHYAAFLVRDFSLYILFKSKDLICS